MLYIFEDECVRCLLLDSDPVIIKENSLALSSFDVNTTTRIYPRSHSERAVMLSNTARSHTRDVPHEEFRGHIWGSCVAVFLSLEAFAPLRINRIKGELPNKSLVKN